jgi:hypothetical protein
MKNTDSRHYNSRKVECANCGHLGRGLPDICDCCASGTVRPINDKREYEAARPENRQ